MLAKTEYLRPNRLRTAVMFGLVLLTLIVVGAWLDSYLWHRDWSWGNSYRGTYYFMRRDSGVLFLEKRTNCDISDRFTRYKTTAYGYRPFQPSEKHEFLGFGFYKGVSYCWYQNLYPITSVPAFSDPRWQKEPYRLLRIPMWPFVVVLAGANFWCVPRYARSWRAWRRARRGHCRRCGYDLTGNTSGVCPECGEEI